MFLPRAIQLASPPSISGEDITDKNLWQVYYLLHTDVAQWLASKGGFNQIARRIPRPIVGGEEAPRAATLTVEVTGVPPSGRMVGGQQVSSATGRRHPAPKSGMPTRERRESLGTTRRVHRYAPRYLARGS